MGLFSFCGYLPRFLPPLVYNGVVEGLNDHQSAFLTLILWFVIGLVFMYFIDFEQGAKEANFQSMAEVGSIANANAPQKDANETNEKNANKNAATVAPNPLFVIGGECNTIMGNGTILEIRSDGSYIVELKWTLAYGNKVLVYTTSNKLTDKK